MALFNNSLMIFDRPESIIPKKMAMIKTATKTTRVPERVSFLEGQVTFFSSVLTSLKNWIAASYFSFIENSIGPPFRMAAVNDVRFTACRYAVCGGGKGEC